jgi:regulator of protease activity HflC (stomatin/prohibitin superfamily)
MSAPGISKTFRRLSAGALFTLLILAFLVIVLWSRIVITVPAGHAGVMWWRFFGGTALTSQPLREGLHLIFPWDKIFLYNTRLQARSEDYDVVSREGLMFSVHMTFRWQPVLGNLGILHATIGPNYVNTLLVPEIGSIARGQMAQFSAEELISSRRAEVQRQIFDSVTSHENTNGIEGRRSSDPSAVVALNDILIKGVALPQRIRTAIEKKLEQEQAIQEARFRVDREKFESERKAVEAEGVRRFQEIVTPTISDAYLRWQGIDATLKLADSPNSKIVIMGNGPGGLPVILNGFEGGASAPARAPEPQSANQAPR